MTSAHLTRLLAAALVLASVVATTVGAWGTVPADAHTGVVVSRDRGALEVVLVVSDRPLIAVTIGEDDPEQGETCDRIGRATRHALAAWRALATN